VGIANNIFFLLLFTTAGLYADAWLQVVYVALALYGWWQWLFGGQRPGALGRRPLTVARTSAREWLVLAALGVLATAGLWALLDRATDSTVPFWDALTTALSLLATYGQCRKRLESWWLWIAADVIYIPLYGYKGLWLTAALYSVFLALCIVGLVSWRADLLRRPAEADLQAQAA
jgi:nicotinamide mononucleotide transporter